MKARVSLIIKIIAIIAVNLFFAAVITLTYTSAGQEAAPALTKIGSRGDDIRELQERLKKAGVYPGQINGVFDGLTSNALREFQQRNGLTADGTASLSTLSALGLAVYPHAEGSVSESEYSLLARFIESEAGGASLSAQTAVGAVALNRVSHPSFPDSLHAVIYNPGAFKSVENGTIKNPAGEDAYRAANSALLGADPSRGALYFSPEGDTAGLPLSRKISVRTGGYVFYR